MLTLSCLVSGQSQPCAFLMCDACLLDVQALHKYKQKRKNLNFTKKIRYESRKQLAQARPRVKGQFVRMTPGGPELTLDSDAQVLPPPIQ